MTNDVTGLIATWDLFVATKHKDKTTNNLFGATTSEPVWHAIEWQIVYLAVALKQPWKAIVIKLFSSSVMLQESKLECL